MSFYTDVIQQDPRFHSIDLCKDMELLEPITRAAVEAIIVDAASMGITLHVTETYRSPARQQHLYNTHVTQLQQVGCHGYGVAADFCKIVDGKASWDGDWSFLRDLANKHGLLSGFDWGHPEMRHSFRDQDHVQRVNVTDQQKMFSGQWYPDDDYLPTVVLPSPADTAPRIIT